MTLAIIMEAFLWLFAIMGFIELLLKVIEAIYTCGKNNLYDVSVVVTVKRKDLQIEHIIKCMQKHLETVSTKRGQPDIYIVDAGMDNETIDIVSSLCSENDNIYLCHPPEIVKIIETKTANSGQLTVNS